MSFGYRDSGQGSLSSYFRSKGAGHLESTGRKGNHMKLVFNIYNIDQENKAMSWLNCQTELARGLVYKPSTVYDTWMAPAGYIPSGTAPPSDAITGVTTYSNVYPPNTYVVPVSLRTNNPVFSPLFVQSLDKLNYSITSPITFTLNFTSADNAGTLRITPQFDMLARSFQTSEFASSDMVELDINHPSVTFTGDECGHCFVGEEKTNYNAASTTAAFSQWSFNHTYDVGVFTCLWTPTTQPTQTSYKPGTVAAQLVVEFDMQIYKYMASSATANVQAWAANKYNTSGGTTSNNTNTSSFVAGAQQGTYAMSKSGELSIGGHGLIVGKSKDGVIITARAKRMYDYMNLRRTLKGELRKKFGKEFAAVIDGSIPIAGVLKDGESLYSMSSAMLHQNLRNIVASTFFGSTIHVRNGLLPLMFNAEGGEMLVSDGLHYFEDSSGHSILAGAPTDQSLFTPLSLPAARTSENILPAPFIIKDRFTLKAMDANATVCCTPENITAFWCPFNNGPVEPGTQNGPTLTETFVQVLSFLSEEAPLAEAAKTTFLGADEQLEEHVETAEVTTSTGMEAEGLRLLAKNSVKIDVPEGLAANNMKTIREQYVSAKRGEIANDTIVGVGLKGFFGAIAGYAASKLKSTNAAANQIAAMKLSRGVKAMSSTKGGKNADDAMIYHQGDAADCAFSVPKCKRAPVTESPPNPEVYTSFFTFQGAKKYTIGVPKDEDIKEAIFVKAKVDLQFAPNLTFGISTPAVWADPTGTAGGEVPFIFAKVRDYTPGEHAMKQLQAQAILPTLESEVLPTIAISRFNPATDSDNAFKNCVFAVLPSDGYQTVKFAPINEGEYLNTRINVESPAGTPSPHQGSMPVIMKNLSFSNKISIEGGFWLPDKLPNANGVLTDLAEGEPFYAFLVYNIRHNFNIKQPWFEFANMPATDSQMIYNGVENLYGVGTQNRNIAYYYDGTTYHYNQPSGYVFFVMSAFDRALMNDGSPSPAPTATGENVTEKHVNQVLDVKYTLNYTNTGYGE